MAETSARTPGPTVGLWLYYAVATSVLAASAYGAYEFVCLVGHVMGRFD